MEKINGNSLTSAMVKAFTFVIAIVVLILFTRTVITVVLLFLLAIVFATIINAPVTWLEKKKIPRTGGTFIIFFLIFTVIGLVSWLIVPILSSQVRNLIENLPTYIGKIETMLSSWKTNENSLTQNLPAVTTNTLLKLGGYSISFLTSFLLLLILISLTAYMVIYPRPLLQLY